MDAAERIIRTLEIARRFGQTEGSHHKAWVIDQMVRTLLGSDYDAWVAAYRIVPGDPTDACAWDEGRAP